VTTKNNAPSAFALLLHEAARISEPPFADAARVPVGSTLLNGRFSLLRQLGEGGSGLVYEAFDEQRGAQVALKLLHRSDAANVYRIKNEFRTLTAISHPNVVRLHELFAEGASWFFTMELVEGVAFDHWVRPEGRLHEVRLRAALAQLVGAVAAIHRIGKLHLDLKPSNVLITAGARVVVLDFGLAITQAAGGIGNTLHERKVSGTPAFMAPEQAAGQPATATSDQYALGAMLFEALTGQLPFDGSVLEVLSLKQTRDAPLASTVSANVPTDLDQLCARLLSREPAARPGIDALLASCAVASAQPAPRADAAAPLFGRDAELQLLRDAFAETRTGASALVSVSGASGIGKSALCKSFLDEQRASGAAVVLEGRCFERESVPFNAIDPVVDALTRYLRGLSALEATALLPRDAFALVRAFPVLARVEAFARVPAQANLDAAELRTRAMEALRELLARLRDRAPLVIHIDDLQWTDLDSVDALRQLLVQRRSIPLLLLVSMRDASEEAGLVDQVLEAARANPSWRVCSIGLESLSERALGALVTSLLGAVEHSVVREAAGSPFWARELCAMSSRAAHYRLADLIAARTASLDGPSRRLLETLALAGGPLPLDVALSAARVDHDALDVLRTQRLVRAAATSVHDRTKRVECQHDRIREAIREALPQERRRTLFAGLAAVLAQAREQTDHELLSTCLEHAGDPLGAARHAGCAAESAQQALAFDRASTLYRRALSLGDRGPAETAELEEKLGAALSLAGRGTLAAAAYRRAAALHDGWRAVELRRRAAEELLATGHAHEGSQLLSEVCRASNVALPTSASHALASLAWTTARLRVRGLRSSESGVVSRERLLRLELAYTVVTGFLGYLPIQSASVAARYLSMALEYGEPRHLTWALGYNATIHTLMDPKGRWPAELLARMDEVAASATALDLTGFACAMHAVEAYHQQRFPRARELSQQAITALQAGASSSFQLDQARLYDHIAAYGCGDYGYLARVVPERIEDAYRRDRIWIGSMLCGPFGAVAFLTPDRPQLMRAHIDRARRQLATLSTPSWPDLVMLTGEVLCDLYCDQPERGYALLETRQVAFRRTMLVRRDDVGRSMVLFLRAQCALAALAKEGVRGESARRSPWFAIGKKCVPELRRHRRWQGLVSATEAGFAHLEGDQPRAIALLRTAVERLHAAGSKMYAAAAGSRLGRELGGDEGRSMIARGEELMRAQGVKDGAAMIALHCPGWSRD
jgi:eukaryotic-like serine/threonine-protein kinase